MRSTSRPSIRSSACTAVVGSLTAGDSARIAMSTSIRSANAGSWSIVRWRATTRTRRARAPTGAGGRRGRAGSASRAPRTGRPPGAPRRSRRSAARAAAAPRDRSPRRRRAALRGRRPRRRGRRPWPAPTRRSAAASGWTSSITVPARRMSPRKIPPICVNSNARCTSATNAPSVTTSRTSPKITVNAGPNSRPARSLWRADGREREQRVGRGRRGKRQAPDHDGIATQPRREPGRVGGRLYLRGDEHRREDDAGERDHAGRQRAEDLLRGRAAIGGPPASPRRSSRTGSANASRIAASVRGEHRNPHRRGEPKAGAQEAAGSQAVVHGAPPAGLGTTSAGSTWTPARAASSLTSPIPAPAPIRRIMRNG